MTKRKDGAIEVSSLPVAVQFITDTGEASLKTQGFPDREILLWAVRLLPMRVKEILDATTNADRESALMKALWHAFTIGSYGTRSDNTKFVSSSGGREGKAQRDAERDRIANDILQASPDKSVKQLQPVIEAKFKQSDLGGASTAYLYKLKKFHD
jgi:hypothetical protein